MIRKAIIVMLTLGTAVVGVAWISTLTLTIATLQTLGLMNPAYLGYSPDITWTWHNERQRTLVIVQAVKYQGSIAWVADYTQKVCPDVPQHDRRQFGPFKYWRRCWKANYPGFLSTRTIGIRFPLWVPLVLFAAYPTIAFIRGPMRRWRRRRKRLCLKCGYNLTGNVSGVCPECGERVRATTSMKTDVGLDEP